MYTEGLIATVLEQLSIGECVQKACELGETLFI